MNARRWIPAFISLGVAALLLLLWLGVRRSQREAGGPFLDPAVSKSEGQLRPGGTPDSTDGEPDVPDSERYSLEQRIELPEFPQAPARSKHAPDPNAADDAAEGTLL